MLVSDASQVFTVWNFLFYIMNNGYFYCNLLSSKIMKYFL